MGPKLDRGAAGTSTGGRGEDVPAPSSVTHLWGLTRTCCYTQPHILRSEPTRTSKKGAGKSTHTNTQEMSVTNTPKSPSGSCMALNHHRASPKPNLAMDLGPQTRFREVPFCTACSSLRLKVEALKHPITSLSQVTDFLLHLISSFQQMLFPQQKPHSTCYSHLKTTLSSLPSSQPGGRPGEYLSSSRCSSFFWLSSGH